MKQDLQQICNDVFFDEPMARHTTIRIGGPADALVYPRSIEQLSSLLLLAREKLLPVFVLGAGSNLVVRDRGIRGLVIALSRGFEQISLEGEARLYAEAGVGVPRLVDFSADEGLTGLEPLAGIPGNVGGAVVMNAGTPDGEIADTVESVTFVDKAGKLTTWEKEKIQFGYRESHFPHGSVVLSVRFQLKRLPSEQIKGRVQKYRSERVEKQPLTQPNLGSVFKNPRPAKRGKGEMTSPLLYAGRLIEDTGLKGIRVGGARISSKHANFIVNEGGATARDVLTLISLVRDKVKERRGVLLETEVKVVGEE